MKLLESSLIFAGLIGLSACGGGSGGASESVIILDPPPPPAAPILETFSLLKENNPELEGDIEFVLEGDTFSARSPTDLSVASLTPTFSFTGTEVSVNGAEQTSGESSQDFTPILNYTVSNESGTTKTYQVDLTRFTGLPIIYLTTESPVVSKEDYVNGTFHLEGGREYNSVDEMAMEIRGRGNSTWFVHPKKPYQMKLESKRDLFGMLEDKKWLFLAEYSDKTLVRNHLAFALGHRLSLIHI